MPVPRIFVSSTCYDLGPIRDDLEHFIRNFGYEPIRSEKGNIYFDTNKDVAESCIDEVPFCQMLVLIIGGRYGSESKETGKSITNMEYNKAKELGIPIFTLVNKKVLDHYEIWQDNKDVKEIKYRHVENPKVFEFIDEVKNASYNNALQPFESFEDIRFYLSQQWSGMMYRFLIAEGKTKQVDNTLSAITELSKKIEYITRQIAKDMGKEKTDLKIKIMDIIAKKPDWILGRLNKKYGVDFSHEKILRNDTFEKLLKSNNFKYTISDKILPPEDEESYVVGTEYIEGSISKDSVIIGKEAFEMAEKQYKRLYEEILSILSKNNITVKDFLSDDK
jgi:hypothetical protein